MRDNYYNKVLSENKSSLITGLLQFFIIIFSIVILRPRNWYTFAGLITVLSLSISSLVKVYNKERLKFNKIFKSASQTFITVTILYFLFRYLRGWGVLGSILIIIIMAGWRMWKQRDFVGKSKAEIEILMFGQPQTQKWRDEMGYEGTFKEYWRNKKNGNKEQNQQDSESCKG